MKNRILTICRLDLFIAATLVDKKVSKNHEIVQTLVIDIYNEAKTKLAQLATAGSSARAGQFRGATGAVPNMLPFGGTASGNPAGSASRNAQSMITSAMLSHALSAASGNQTPSPADAAAVGMISGTLNVWD